MGIACKRGAAGGIRLGEQTTDEIVGEAFGNLGGRHRTFGAEPAHAPVECAENGARDERGVAGDKFARARAGYNDLAHSFFVTIPFGYEAAWQARGQGAGQEMGGRAFDFVEHATDM